MQELGDQSKNEENLSKRTTLKLDNDDGEEGGRCWGVSGAVRK